MRPTRLELDGFTAFKEPTVVDFSDADYFALVGLTGSGKSTIIDAICFALYGSVPRYDSRNLVHPVISQGGLEAKVRLDFTVQGTSYTVVRIVRRSGKGASTKEARLQRGDEVIAGTADELRLEVPKLLGLTYDHFTKSVVLPQGEFARFLHDEPSKRQELIIELLNLDVYNRMMKLANARASNRKNEVLLRRKRIDEDFAFATQEALSEKTSIVERLDVLRDQVAEMTPKIFELEERQTKTTADIEEAREAIELLAELEVPDEIAGLSKRLATAHADVKAIDKQLAELKSKTKKALDQLAKLGDPAPLTTALKTYDRAESLVARVRAASAEAAESKKAANAAAKSVQNTETQVRTATKAVDAARRADLAAHLAQGLKKGDPCPVCEQKITTVPKHTARADLDQAEAALADATAALDGARHESSEADKKLAEVQGGLTQLEKELTAVRGDLAEAPSRKDIEKTLAAIAEAQATVERARADENEAAEALDAARHAIKDLETERTAATKAFHTARDAVAALKPPAAGHDDLAADWDALVRWAQRLVPALEKEVAAANASIEKIETEKKTLFQTIAEACEQCAVDLSDGDPKDAVVSALARAKADVERIEQALIDKDKLEKEAVDLQSEHDVANTLAQHLSAKGFEKWIVNEALQHLVIGATEILHDLSNGQYSLVVDDAGNFLVKDHHNADETRLAKTLSGGETFLASLSLALALADQLTDLAAEGAAHLESIFLDEGFGTLDAETLDTVAATVENLAATGRMVGIVTHVRELAERVPMQFRVTKTPSTSTVEKVVA